MAYGRTRRGGSFFAGRGAILAVIVALHAVAVVGFARMGLVRPVEAESPAVEVVFVEERTQATAPAPQPVRLADVRPVQVAVPVVELPAETPAPAAITVTPPAPQVAAAAPVASDADVPVSVEAVDFVKPPAPRYPQSARLARVQGTVWLRALIDREGRPKEVSVHRSSGSQQLDAAARESVLLALFRPHRVNGEPRSFQVLIPIEFASKVRTARRDDDPVQRVGHRLPN